MFVSHFLFAMHFAWG